MADIKYIAQGFAFCILGTGLLVLIGWEWHLGFAAGSYGGVSLRQMPGMAGFVLVLQGIFGAWLVRAGTRAFRRKTSPPRRTEIADISALAAGGLLTFLGIWGAAELIARIVRLLRGMTTDIPSMAVTGVLLFASLGVFLILLFSMIIRPVFDHFRSGL